MGVGRLLRERGSLGRLEMSSFRSSSQVGGQEGEGWLRARGMEKEQVGTGAWTSVEQVPAASGTWPRRGWSVGCSDSLEYHGPGGDEAQTTDPPAVPATSEGAE